MCIGKRGDRRADITRFTGDPLWDTIQSEALAEAGREPVLRPVLEQAVLHRRSFGDGIAMLLAQKLREPALDAAKFYKQLRDVIANDTVITKSASKDLSAIRKRDPATTSLLHRMPRG